MLRPAAKHGTPVAAVLVLVGSLVLAGCGGAAPAGSGGNGHPAATDMGSGLKPARGGPYQAHPADAPPAVEFEPAEMAFGILPPGSAVQGSSRLWNVGAKPLRVVRSITTCGCTAAEDLTGRVIEPGGYTEFTTVMSMKSGLGAKREKITVFFDDGSWVAHMYTAEVALPVRVVPPYLTASQRRADGSWAQTTSGVVEVTADDGQPFRILAAHGAPPEIIDYDPAVDPPRASYRVRWDLTRFEEDSVPWYWVLETDRPDCPVVDARVRHLSTIPPKNRVWVSKQHRVLVGEVRNGRPVEISASIEYHRGEPAEPERAGVYDNSEVLDAELLETQADGSFLHYRVRLTPRGAALGLLYEQVTLYASGFSTQLRVIGRVVE
ncbi:MAG: DUF1573 domain-containing protein [Planctomycetota bacterium]